MKYLVVVVLAWLWIPQAVHAATVIDIAFPVQGDVYFTDTFDDPRSGGRTHNATDIMADKMTPIVAVVDGVIDYAPTEEPSYGYMITLNGDDGYEYNYVHINNDTPGTDDGEGGPENAYAPGIAKGVRVSRGQLIAWVGDSGNAEDVGSHCHFEIIASDGTPINPYESLVKADDGTEDGDNSGVETANSVESLTINDDKGLVAGVESPACTSDTLIRTAESPTVYYCGANGGRYVFPNETTYFSWYQDFDSVTTISTEVMGTIPMKGSVTVKPGSYLLKLPSVPKVYSVTDGGELHWVPTAEIATSKYGTNWSSLVRDLPESFYPAYHLGEDVTTVT
jgi:murein DD-endopeptidase MepM/ murein hydrolase activator NlpD